MPIIPYLVVISIHLTMYIFLLFLNNQFLPNRFLSTDNMINMNIVCTETCWLLTNVTHTNILTAI